MRIYSVRGKSAVEVTCRRCEQCVSVKAASTTSSIASKFWQVLRLPVLPAASKGASGKSLANLLTGSSRSRAMPWRQRNVTTLSHVAARATHQLNRANSLWLTPYPIQIYIPVPKIFLKISTIRLRMVMWHWKCVSKIFVNNLPIRYLYKKHKYLP